MKTINDQFAETLNIDEHQKAAQDRGFDIVQTKARAIEPSSWGFGWGGNGQYSNTGPIPIGIGMFNGEKSPGALGIPLNLMVDPRALRFRAYEANTTNDVINIITSKFFKWVIGTGLKMQAQPSTTVLTLEKINIDNIADFITNAEAYFSLWSGSTKSDYSGMDNLHLNAAKGFETSFLGGDAIVIARVDEKFNITSQIIDGQHLGQAILDQETNAAIADRGNIVIGGIEMDEKGKHIAYYISKHALEGSGNILVNMTYERIECYGRESGCRMAWMLYGKKNRIDHHRGISMLSAILEKVTKLDRYTEATVATAEERSKLVWTVVHGKTSTGENPLIDGPRLRHVGPDAENPYVLGGIAASQIALTEERKVYNMPVDSELKAVSSTAEINYEPFWKAVFVQLCAAVDIPPEVALQQYNSNYSASRAAINAWGYIVDIYRKKFSDKYYQPFYELWLYIHALKGKIDAPGYLEAKRKGNWEVVEAYSLAKFTGKNMPHIDPLKEVNAIRIALGMGDNSPLTTHEDAVEQLGFGDWDSNIKRNIAEKKIIEDNELNPTVQNGMTVEEPDDSEDPPKNKKD